MSQVALTFPDSTYSSSNKPSVATLKSDLQAIETAHNDLDTNAVTATSTTVMTNKTLTAPIITTPTIKTYNGWQLVSDTWAYASADTPTFTITVPSGAASLYGVGMRIKLNQTTDKYFIITAVADTVLTVYGGTDYTLANAAISSVYVSLMKAPLGFPLDPTKWQVEVKDTTDRSVSGTGTTWNNVGTTNAQISIPIGAWNVSYQVSAFGDRTTAGTGDGVAVTLSTANNTASDVDFTSLANYYGSGVANSDDVHGGMAVKSKYLVLATKTLYYLNARMDNNGTWYYKNSTYGSMILRAECSYL